MIKIKSIQKVYLPKKGKKVNAIDEISLLFPGKGLVFILGKSGSGKSTFLNLLGGLDIYDSGEIIFKGKSTKDFTQSDFDNLRNSYIGFIFQEYNILDEFSIKENISLAIKLQGRSPKDEEINHILKEVDLVGLGERKPNELSGGQKQRVAIARALVKNPEVILADEPTGSLDSKTGIQILDTLKKLSKEKLVIVVSHDREFAEKYGDRVIELSDGKIINDTSKYPIDNIINKEEEFKSIKSKLPLKDTIKIAVGSLKNKKIRLIITILLSVIAFCLFGLADNISSYNRKEALINTIIDENIPAVNFYAKDLSWYSWHRYMSDEDINILNEELGMNFKPVYNGMNLTPGSSLNLEIDNIMDIGKLDGNNSTILQGVYEIEEEELQTLGYDFVGNLPSSYSEIAITRYLFDSFKKCGYSYSDDNGEIVLQPEEINNVNDIIGKKISIVNPDSIISGTYTITAVIDTNFDESKYLSKNPEIPYTQAFKVYIASGYHDLGFVTPGFINHFENTRDIYGLNLFGTGELVYRFDNQRLDVQNVLKSSDISNDKIYFFDDSKSSISENEVLINAESFLRLMRTELDQGDITEDLINYYPEDLGGYYFDNLYINFIKRKALRPYAEEYYQEAIQNGFSYPDYYEGDSEEKKIDKFIDYLISYGYLNNIYTNSCGYDLCIDELTLTIEKYLSRYQNTQITTEFKNFYNPDVIINASTNIVGTFISSKKMYNNYGKNGVWAVLDDQNYNSFNNLFDTNPYEWVIAPMPKSRVEVAKIVEYYYENSENTKSYVLNNAAESMLTSADVNLREISVAFLPIGIGFALFSCVMLSNFIATSISYKKREIGILRALGARSKDIFSIFFTESLIISLVNSILAILFTFISIHYINNFIKEDLEFLITILHFSIRQIFLIICMSILVAYLSSFIPVYKIARKKPIDAIVNR